MPNTKTIKKIRKPAIFRTRNIYAEAFVEISGKRTVRFYDRGSVGMWSDVGVTVPSIAEFAKFTKWMTAARAWTRQRNFSKKEQR